MNFAETCVPIELGGKQVTLIFNANSMKAFEKATGKFFLDTVAQLYEAMRPGLDKGAEATNAFDIVHKVPMEDLVALIWAALHEYGRNPADLDEPFWPMTVNRVGRMIQLQDVPLVFTAFLRGQIKNSPNQEEMGESQARSAMAPASGDGAASKIEAAVGGERSIDLPADVFV